MTSPASRRLAGDRGQAFPVYITAVAGLLFLAFAYFAVGQAAVKRNEAQTAADAAALAAAQDFRDQLRNGLLDTFDLARWQKLLDGDRGGLIPHDSCPAARELASRNDATADICELSFQPEPTYQVAVQTNKTAGHSVIAATQDHKGKAKAAAVVVPRCQLQEAPGSGPTTEPPEPGPGPAPGESPGPGGPGGEQKAYRLVCDKRDFEIDPGHLDLLPKASDLFSVHLADK
ncbi:MULTISPECIES: pilus assembly protein TadG-related protein [unclassified Streptomyces]|uniref:Pilus assembly protein TadG-related protein n=1 Tax=Streptomyces sp. NBC_00060 TaxID=2975636 RepID=A0AAU2HET2_9ACTN